MTWPRSWTMCQASSASSAISAASGPREVREHSPGAGRGSCHRQRHPHDRAAGPDAGDRELNPEEILNTDLEHVIRSKVPVRHSQVASFSVRAHDGPCPQTRACQIVLPRSVRQRHDLKLFESRINRRGKWLPIVGRPVDQGADVGEEHLFAQRMLCHF
jgi:hypothetical protein